MNPIRTTAAAFAIFVGIAIVGLWAVFLLTDQIPEWNSSPIETSLHLAAEFVTAIFLVASGAGLLLRQAWARDLYLFAMGLLMYSVIQAAGYYAQRGQMMYILMFALFALLAMMFTVLLIFETIPIPTVSRPVRRWRISKPS
jgi:hypothetical protein